MKPAAHRFWKALVGGNRLAGIHRLWWLTAFLFGLGYIFALPPFQTNDEDSHWLHMWGVALGDLRCNAPKPSAAGAIYAPLHMSDVRWGAWNWRSQYLRDAMKYVGSDKPTTEDGTACSYQPLPYLFPGLIARFVAFGAHGTLRAGSMLRAFYAARITNWILASLAVLILCWRVPWAASFVLFIYSIPEFMQQAMAINTDAFLFVTTAALLILMFGARARTATLAGIAVVVALMTVTKVVYWVLAAGALLVVDRLVVNRRWRARDVVALASLVILPYLAQLLWLRYAYATTASVPSADATVVARQLAFLKAHPLWIFTLLHSQWHDLFGVDLMKGSWLSIFGAFGWSQYTMAPWAYRLMLLGGIFAIAADALAGRAELEPLLPGRYSRATVALVASAVFALVVAVIVGMYVYFSAAILNRVGFPDVDGVQGRYLLIPIWIWGVLLICVIRRRTPLPPRAAGYPLVLATLALNCCVLADLAGIDAIYRQYYAAYATYRH